MRLIVAAFAFVIAGFAATPAMAQDDAICQQSLINLEDVRLGKSPPIGIEPDGARIKPSGDYKAPADEAAFAVDAYREHGDVRAWCAEAKWPATVKSENLKKALTAAAKANPKAFCGGDMNIEARVPAMIRSWVKDAGPEFFLDRAQELQGAINTTSGVKHQEVWRHNSDTEWLAEVIIDLDAVCPNGEAALDIGSAKAAVGMARDFAKENVAFVDCVKARKAWDPQMKAFDALVPAGDQAAMGEAYKKLEAAAGAVRETCKASEEGLKETEYLLASRKLRILFLTAPGCRDAALAMNTIRTNLNSAPKSSIPSYISEIQRSAKDASVACKDPSAETWGNFVAWIANKNLTRIADPPAQ